MDIFEGRHFNIDSHGYFRCGRKRVHRMIWEHFHGAVPKGFDIHHKDGDKFNNSIDNLECICHREHLSMHMKTNSIKIHAWLKTDKGKKFLSDKAKKEFQNRPQRLCVCAECGKEFCSIHTVPTKFCSNSCMSMERRKSGKDNEERSCVICSKPFTINKYQYTKTCSKPCRAKHIGNVKRKTKSTPSSCGAILLRTCLNHPLVFG